MTPPLQLYKYKVVVNNGNKPQLSVFQLDTSLPVERNPIHTPIDTQENTTISAGGGGCRFIDGQSGAYSCIGMDPRFCHKSRGASVLILTPRCFSYHDRFIQVVTV